MLCRSHFVLDGIKQSQNGIPEYFDKLGKILYTKEEKLMLKNLQKFNPDLHPKPPHYDRTSCAKKISPLIYTHITIFYIYKAEPFTTNTHNPLYSLWNNKRLKRLHALSTLNNRSKIRLPSVDNPYNMPPSMLNTTNTSGVKLPSKYICIVIW